MGEWLQQYFNQIKEIWDNLNTRAKVIIGVGALGVITALILLMALGGQTGYQPLFTQLGPRDADAIVESLEEKGISYRLEDNGATILVPENNVHKARLDMAGEGLPSQGVVGFEIFNQSQFGTTDFERKINYYRAIGGELSRSISSMSTIDFARVQLSPPQESIFQEKEKPAEASVLLRLKPGVNLDRDQINAISNLVASSVRGLDTDKVTIVDTAGNLLAAQNKDDGFHTNANTVNNFEIQNQFEDNLKQDLTVMLSKVLGPDNFSIEVHAHLNFDKRQEESEIYTPVVEDEGIIRSIEEQEEIYEGESTSGEGVPGTTSNIPQYQGEDADVSQTSQEKSNTITNYEINKRISRHEYAPGTVDRLSVAVILNEDLDNQVIERIRSSIQTAIGYNSGRDDQVTVTRLPFDRSLEQEMTQAAAAAREAQKREKYLYSGLIALILIILLISFIVFRSRSETEPVQPGQTVDMIAGDEIEKAEEEAADEISEEDRKRQQMKEQLKDLVSDQPEEVAQILKSWLTEE